MTGFMAAVAVIVPIAELVVFALVMISSFNHNFNLLFRSEAALGGWDVVVDDPMVDMMKSTYQGALDALKAKLEG